MTATNQIALNGHNDAYHSMSSKMFGCIMTVHVTLKESIYREKDLKYVFLIPIS